MCLPCVPSRRPLVRVGGVRVQGEAPSGAPCPASRVFVANVGDSRAVLSRGGIAVDLSSDQVAARPDERARIEVCGVAVCRMCGCEAVCVCPALPWVGLCVRVMCMRVRPLRARVCLCVRIAHRFACVRHDHARAGGGRLGAQRPAARRAGGVPRVWRRGAQAAEGEVLGQEVHVRPAHRAAGGEAAPQPLALRPRPPPTRTTGMAWYRMGSLRHGRAGLSVPRCARC